MSLDWAGPVATAAVGVAGVFFTWLTRKQARREVAQMAAQSLRQAQLQRVRAERREA
jgi:hypothetical protein